METKQQDIYIISAIKLCLKQLPTLGHSLDKFQEIHIEKFNKNDKPKDSSNERTDTTVFYLDDIEKDRNTNKGIVAVSIRHYHTQERYDNYGCIIYTK